MNRDNPSVEDQIRHRLNLLESLTGTHRHPQDRAEHSGALRELRWVVGQIERAKDLGKILTACGNGDYDSAHDGPGW